MHVRTDQVAPEGWNRQGVTASLEELREQLGTGNSEGPGGDPTDSWGGYEERPRGHRKL